MKKSMLYALWGGMYLLCGVLGIVSVPGWLGILACLLFFVPPALLLLRERTENTARTVVILSGAWLVLTLLLLVLNICSVSMTELAGRVLYYLLVVLSSPMVCGQYWLIALFLWACLLMAGLQQLKKKK